VPLYRRIADDLATAISEGEYDGRGLPSESELSSAYGVSRGTVRQAFAQLRADGVVTSRRGARRQASEGPLLQSMGELLGFTRWARSLGQEPSSRTIGAVTTGATAEVAEALGVDAGAEVLHVVRVRLLGGTPAMLEDTHYPAHLARLITDLDLDAESITECLESQGIALAHAEHHLEAVPADADVARLLDVEEGAPLLRTTRRTTDPHGAVVEYSVDLYRGEAVSFVVRNSATATTTNRVTPG
jgi:GntR family transcriptional regulator